LVFSNLTYHKSRYFSSSNAIAASIVEKRTNISQYFSLTEENNLLANQNALLLQQKFNYNSFNQNDTNKKYIFDSIPYMLITAKVINSTVNLPQNFITINKGLKHGVEPEMGVITENGAVGIVKDVSENFATIIPLINTNISLSLAIKNNGTFGFYEWDGKNYQFAQLVDIPKHIEVNVGDSLITRGSTGSFPPNLLVAVVNEINNEEGNNYQNIQIKLSNNFRSLNHVYVVKNSLKSEKEILELNF